MGAWTLAHPAALWALLLALPVLAAHLVHRRRRRVVVPFTGLLLEAHARVPGSRGWRRVAEAAALAARLLALGALVLALAGPRRAPAAPPAPLVLVLDADATTAAREADGRTRFEHLAALAAAHVRAAAGASLSLVRAGAVPRLLAREEADAEALAVRLSSTGPEGPGGPEPSRADLAAAVDLARALAGRAGRVLLLSARSAPAAEARADGVEGAGATDANQGLTALALAPAAEAPRLELTLRVVNEASAPVRRTLRLTLGGVVAEERVLELAAQGAAEVRFEVLPPAGGADAQVLLVGADALARDDRADLSLPAPLRPSVLAVHAGPGLRPYTAALLAALGDEILREASGAVAARDLVDAQPRDVTLVDGAALPEGALRPGAYVFLAPLAGALPFRVGAPVERPLVWRTRPGHPLVRDLALGEAWVSRAFPLLPQPGLVGLAFAAGEEPVVAEGERGGVRFVVLGLDPEQSDLPVRAALPLLVRNAILRLARAPAAPLPPWVAAGGRLAPLLALPGGPEAALAWPGGEAAARLAPQEPGWPVPAGAQGLLRVRTGPAAGGWSGTVGLLDLDPGRLVRPARAAAPLPPPAPGNAPRPGSDLLRLLLGLAALLLVADLLLSRGPAPKVAASPPRGSIGPWSTASFAKR